MSNTPQDLSDICFLDERSQETELHDGSHQKQTNGVHALHELLSSAFPQVDKHQVDESTPAGACLRPLLLALSWSGEDRHLSEALPHFERVSDIDGLRAVLAALNFETHKRTTPLTALSRATLPCLLADPKGNLSVVLDILDDGRLLIFDGSTRDFEELSPSGHAAGTIYIVHETDEDKERAEQLKLGWMQMVLGKFKRTFATLFFLSLGINLLALMVPLYIMSVYEKAIGAQSITTLVSLFAGIGLVIAAEIIMRRIRGRAIAYLGTRIESLVAVRAFQQLLYMPVTMTETASISTQITRLKQYENVRDLFTGSLASALLDLPFIFLFVIAVFAIGGVLGFVPLALIVLYMILAAITIPITNTHMRRAGAHKTALHNFMMETTSKHRSLRDAAAQDIWIERSKTIIGDQLASQFKAQQFNVSIQTIAQMLMMIAGASTVGIGTVLAIDGGISMGALIGATALVWRGLAPIQSAFFGLSRLGQSLDSLRQINQLMRMKLERQPGKHATLHRKFKGNISIKGSSLRYSSQTETSLRGLSLEIKSGEMIAVTGNSGAGKSTLLKMIAGLYRPQVGAVRMDGLDIRQLDMGEFRHAIGYVPQKQSLFYGTIAQNMRLAHPSATPLEIEHALAQAGALETVKTLPGGIEYRLHGRRETGFSNTFLKQLMLARAFVKKAPIYLLDEPGSHLDMAGDEALMEALRKMKGKSTIIMVTHRPSHMYLADRVVVLHQGQLVADAPPKEIVPVILSQGKNKARRAT